jgi:hypothetical protein
MRKSKAIPRKTVNLLVVAAASLVGACDRHTTSTKSDAGEAQLAELEKAVEKQGQQIASLQEETERLRKDVGIVAEVANRADMQLPKMSVVTLRPDDSNYQTLSWDLGRLTLALVSADKHPKGTRITLRIGNPNYARLYRVKARVAYGEVDNRGQPIEKSTQVKTALLSEYVDAGSWRATRLVLVGVPAERFGYITIGDIKAETVSMQR